jgi:anti-sigma regulatory factor (Ser/Thr protein kinase)
MSSQSYTIVGNDFDRGGMASHRLKQQLKKLGVAPDIIRRTIIAAYEAEMNVVIYAHRGSLYFTLSDSQIDVEVMDEGPGIPDIELAMTEGYSTASPKIREMGFGLGLGLPNMKKASDFFEIQSTLGKGTRIHFSNNLREQRFSMAQRNSLLVKEEECVKCYSCVRACPTAAIRIRKGRPEVIDSLCIDCTACIGVCTTGALNVDLRSRLTEIRHGYPLILGQGFYFQFGAGVEATAVIDALKKLGFSKVHTFQPWSKALSTAVFRYAQEEASLFPVISPVCPAVVNLIQMRFPSLLPQVAPFLTPFEAAAEDTVSLGAFFAPACPAQCTAVRRKISNEKGVLIEDLFQAVASLIFGKKHVGKTEALLSETPDTHKRKGSIEWQDQKERDEKELGPSPRSSMERNEAEWLVVSGMAHVIEVLEKVENGLAGDVHLLDLYACEQGCFGSPLLKEEAFIARHRFELSRVREHGEEHGHSLRREEPLLPRPGLRLDENMQRAILKLAEIDRLISRLPGTNCALCGAPSCFSFAEDVVLGRASKEECIFLKKEGKEDEVG